MEFLTPILSVIIFTWILAQVAAKFKIPKVVAYIIAGVLINAPLLSKPLLGIPDTASFIKNMGDIALLSLMFVAGLETSAKELLHERRDAIAISLLAAMTPFILGFWSFYLLGYPIVSALIIGISMSISSEASTTAFLLEVKKIRTRMGTLMIEAGIIDDILGLAMFLIVTFFLKENNLKEDILVSGAILAFFSGILLQHRLNNGHLHLARVKRWLFVLVIPFFFTSMGTHFKFSSILANPKILFLIIAIASLGKFFGSLMAKPFTKLSWKKLQLIGWAMNSRGAVELALILISLRSGLITIETYSSLLLMALTTTVVFPLALSHMIKRYPKIMD